jgi:hypothetical protein
MNRRRSLHATVFAIRPCVWVLRVGEMDAEVSIGGIFEFQPGSPALLKMGGRGDVGLNLWLLLSATVFTISPYQWVLRVGAMDIAGMDDGNFEIQPGSPALLKKAGGGAVVIGLGCFSTPQFSPCAIAGECDGWRGWMLRDHPDDISRFSWVLPQP